MKEGRKEGKDISRKGCKEIRKGYWGRKEGILGTDGRTDGRKEGIYLQSRWREGRKEGQRRKEGRNK